MSDIFARKPLPLKPSHPEGGLILSIQKRLLLR